MLENTYIVQKDTPYTSRLQIIFSSPALVSFLLTIEDSSIHVSVTQELHSASRHEFSNAGTASSTHAGLTTVLSRRPPFEQLSSGEQEELRAMLEDDMRKMKRLFGCFVTKTCTSIENRIPLRNFTGSILALGAYEPAPEERDQSLLDEHREEIKRAESIAEIFNILSAYWNYLSYEILEYIIDLYGTSDDTKRLKSYDEELQNFCKRRIFELPLPESCSSTGISLSPRQVEFNVKLNVREDITMKELRQIKTRIAKILQVNQATLIIDRVYAGCVQITFLIPKFVAQEIFPLCDEQTSALSKDASVIRLECKDYVFKVLEQFHFIVIFYGVSIYNL